LIKKFCLNENGLYVARRTLNSDRIELYKINEESEEYKKR
jgi:hypothetical protein